MVEPPGCGVDPVNGTATDGVSSNQMRVSSTHRGLSSSTSNGSNNEMGVGLLRRFRLLSLSSLIQISPSINFIRTLDLSPYLTVYLSAPYVRKVPSAMPMSMNLQPFSIMVMR